MKGIKWKLCIVAVSLASLHVSAEGWKVTEGNDPMAESKTYYATSPMVKSLEGMRHPYSDVESWIGVGCSNKYYWAYIGYTNSNFTGGEYKRGKTYHKTKIKYDDKLENITLFEGSSGRDHLEVYIKDERHFLRQIMSSNEVTTGISWHKMGDVWFKYPLSGSDGAIREVFEKCKAVWFW